MSRSAIRTACRKNEDAGTPLLIARTVSDRAESLINCWLGMIHERKAKPAHMYYSPLDSFRDRGRQLLRTALEVQVADPETQQMLSADERRFEVSASP